jgi:hypothetical protein
MIEDGMAATRKSAKRRTAKKTATGAKRAARKRATGRKRSSTKSARRSRSGRVSVPKLKRKARRGLGMAKEGLDTVRKAGGKAWKTLKSTTTQIIDNVRDK